jgi:hypothetical protein
MRRCSLAQVRVTLITDRTSTPREVFLVAALDDLWNEIRRKLEAAQLRVDPVMPSLAESTHRSGKEANHLSFSQSEHWEVLPDGRQGES